MVCAKPPFAGAGQVLEYLGRYTHRVAISNDRLVSLDQGVVRFGWKDCARGNHRKTMALPAEEFLRGFLLRVLPGGFVRIRRFGLLANRGRTAKLARCRALLVAMPPEAATAREPGAALMLRVIGINVTRCPVCCAGRLYVVGSLRSVARPVPVCGTPHEPGLTVPPANWSCAPPCAEGRRRVSPARLCRPSGRSGRPHLPPGHPHSPEVPPGLSAQIPSPGPSRRIQSP